MTSIRHNDVIRVDRTGTAGQRSTGVLELAEPLSLTQRQQRRPIKWRRFLERLGAVAGRRRAALAGALVGVDAVVGALDVDRLALGAE